MLSQSALIFWNICFIYNILWYFDFFEIQKLRQIQSFLACNF